MKSSICRVLGMCLNGSIEFLCKATLFQLRVGCFETVWKLGLSFSFIFFLFFFLCESCTLVYVIKLVTLLLFYGEWWYILCWRISTELPQGPSFNNWMDYIPLSLHASPFLIKRTWQAQEENRGMVVRVLVLYQSLYTCFVQ